ncbi:hypothetical protein DFH28DRAFT_1120302 [Melampsora americana]|nr:hypothetical protein DFH28DRAFT_1120302 [Melampsora americana]
MNICTTLVLHFLFTAYKANATAHSVEWGTYGSNGGVESLENWSYPLRVLLGMSSTNDEAKSTGLRLSPLPRSHETDP